MSNSKCKVNMPGHQMQNGTTCLAGRLRPDDVGIVAIEVYFPSRYVDQTELEEFDGVSAGKYTVGLGQMKMGFCDDREDVHSLCLTVVDRLVRKWNIDYRDIGRLEVGTETILDKSKSVKTVLMQLFEESGNTDVEGIDTTNACYGGTAALFNALDWVESSAWDGRYALVVASDIAVYAKGNARPTGGAGAVAMLIGANAPLVIDQGVRSSHMQHAYDFYKPDLSSEYPHVDGKLSIQCYLSALDKCYQRYCAKVAKKNFGENVSPISLQTFDAVLFHSPFCKLVQKSFARLLLNDIVRGVSNLDDAALQAKLSKTHLEDTYFDRDIEKSMLQASGSAYEMKTKPSLLLSSQVGNMYTPSLYAGLVSFLVSKPASELAGSRVGLFSYGSGFASTFYSLTVTSDGSAASSLSKLTAKLSDVKPRLESRRKVSPIEFDNVMQQREEAHHKVPYIPSCCTTELFPGTWYLTEMDDKYRRSYSLLPHAEYNGRIFES